MPRETVSVLVAGTNADRVQCYVEAIVLFEAYSVITATDEKDVLRIISGPNRPDLAIFIVTDTISKRQWHKMKKLIKMEQVLVGAVMEIREDVNEELRYILWGDRRANPNPIELEMFLELIQGITH